MKHDKRRLQAKLRQVVTRQQDNFKLSNFPHEARHRSCLAILDAVETFLHSWEKVNNHGDDVPSDLPNNFLRNTLELVVSKSIRGDPQIRERLLRMLSSMNTHECRQVVLDALPATLPITHDESVSEHVLRNLRGLVTKDETSIFATLDTLLMLDLPGGNESFLLALDTLSRVSEEDLCELVRRLITNVTNEEEAKDAVDAVRVEMRSLEATTSASDPWEEIIADIIQVLLSAITNNVNGELLTGAYISVLETTLKNSMDPIDQCVTTNTSERGPVLLLDLAVLITLKEHDDYRDAMETLLYSLLESHLSQYKFFLNSIVKLVQCDKLLPSEGKSSRPINTFVPSLLSFCVFLLLSPLRITMPSTSRGVLLQSKDFIADLHSLLNPEGQGQLIQRLFHLSHELAVAAVAVTKASATVENNRKSGSQKRRVDIETIRMINNTVYEILVAICKTDHGSLIPFHNDLLDRLISPSLRSTHDASATKKLCFILCFLQFSKSENVSSSGIGQDTSDLLSVLQYLLFSSPDTCRTNFMGDHERVVRGLTLATELVCFKHVSKAYKDIIRQWITRILLPVTRRMVDPEIGSPGLRFLHALHEQNAAISSCSDAKVSLHADIFQTVQMVLANTGLVQMLAYYKLRPKKRGLSLGYTTRPTFLRLDGTKRKFRSIVFSVGFFLRDSSMVQPSRWNYVSKWVFDLVNAHLVMGRQTGKWIPHGWVDAAIELPHVKLPNSKAGNKRQRFLSNWMYMQVCKHELSAKNFYAIEKDARELSIILEEAEDLDELFESLCSFTLSLLICIGVSAAVLKNTFEKYEKVWRTSGELNSGVQYSEAIQLVQHQLLKMFDLRRKCRSVECIFRAIKVVSKRLDVRGRQSSGRKKRLKQKSGTSTKFGSEAMEASNAQRIVDIDSALGHLTSIIALFFQKSNFVNPDILWLCLADTAQDMKISESVNGELGSREPLLLTDSPRGEEMRLLLYMRKAIIEDLIARVERESTREGIFSRGSSRPIHEVNSGMSRSRMTKCLRVGSQLSHALPKFRTIESESEIMAADEISLSSALAKLIAAYFRLLFLVLLRFSDYRQTLASKEASIQAKTATETEQMAFEDFMHLYTVLLASENALEEVLEVRDSNRHPRNVCLDNLFESFLVHLRVCEDAEIAIQLIDTLSVVAMNYKREFLSKVSDVSWTSLHTVYSTQDDVMNLQTPFAFLHAVQRAIPSSDLGSQQSTPAQRALLSTIVKSSASNSKEFERNSLLVHGMLRQWGLLASSSEAFAVEDNHLSKMCDNLSNLLSEIHEVPSAENKEDTSDDDEDYCPPRSMRKLQHNIVLSPIAGLNDVSFPVYFEVLLHMAVSAFAIAPPSIITTTVTLREEDMARKGGPFLHLEHLAKSFGSVIVLFKEKLAIFPRRTMSLVIHASKSMLIVAIYQLHNCVEWRSSQPMLSMEEKDAGVQDFASIHYLNLLLDSVGSHIVGSLLSLCDHVDFKSSGITNLRSEGNSDSRTQVQFGDQSKINGFRSAINKAKHAMETVASSHNLRSPRFSIGTDIATDEERQRKRKHFDAIRGFHQLKQTMEEPSSTPERKVAKKDEFSDKSGARDAGTPQAQLQCFDNDGYNETSDIDWVSEDDSESSGSFCVRGDWGKACDNDTSSGDQLSSPPMVRQK